MLHRFWPMLGSFQSSARLFLLDFLDFVVLFLQSLCITGMLLTVVCGF